jgi:hypothetical protein
MHLAVRDGTQWLKGQLKFMSSMIEEHHERFTGVWFSGFVRMGQGGPLEMITTCKVLKVFECNNYCVHVVIVTG